RERGPGLELDEQVDERLADERVAVDALAPLLAVRRVDGGLEERAPVDAEAHERDAEPAAVHHLHHPGEAAARTGLVGPDRARGSGAARHPGAGTGERDLGRRDPDGPELRLQPLDVE